MVVLAGRYEGDKKTAVQLFTGPAASLLRAGRIQDCAFPKLDTVLLGEMSPSRLYVVPV